jgi:hypothetical protein
MRLMPSRARVSIVIAAYNERATIEDDEGKKITWRDGVRGVWCTLRYGLVG